MAAERYAEFAEVFASRGEEARHAGRLQTILRGNQTKLAGATAHVQHAHSRLEPCTQQSLAPGPGSAPEANEPFDAVIGRLIFFHLPDRFINLADRLAEEISRVLKITDGVMRHLAVHRIEGGSPGPPPPEPEPVAQSVPEPDYAEANTSSQDEE